MSDTNQISPDGKYRWDGNTWVENQTAAAPKAPSTWWKKPWVIAVAALLVGIGIGSASATSDPKTSAEYKSLAGELETVKGDLETTRGDLSIAEANAEAVLGSLPAREEAVEKAEAAVEKAAAGVTKAEAAVTKREKAVQAAENRIEQGTIPGDGVFQVGIDMKPGTYRMAGASCYWSINGDANGNNIIANNNVEGPALVEVQSGQFFETSRCDEWVLQ